MATFCYNCLKTSNNGNIVSHAKNRTKHVRKPNLHTAHIILDGVRKKISLCTKCMRTVVRAHQVNA